MQPVRRPQQQAHKFFYGHGRPVSTATRVLPFNPETNRSEDVSHAVAHEVLRRLGLEGRSVPSVLEDFIDRHVGKDRQLTLRLAVAG